jgi:hypothetical protein
MWLSDGEGVTFRKRGKIPKTSGNYALRVVRGFRVCN